MYDHIKRKSGGQPGNQNARRHGFYSKVLSSHEKRELEHAAGVDGLDEEIAIMRIKFRWLLKNDGENLPLINHTVESIARLHNVTFNRNKNNTAAFKEAVASVLEQFIIPGSPVSDAPLLPQTSSNNVESK